MRSIRGLGKSMPFTSFMLTAGTLAIVGAPPFAIFVGEFTLISAAVSDGAFWIAGLMVILLAIVFAGFVRNVFPMITGDPGREIDQHASVSRRLPLIILFIATLFLGLFMTDGMQEWLSNAVGCLGMVL